MSWLFSRALVEAYSLPRSSASELSVPSSVTPMPQAYFWHDRTTVACDLSRYGMTSEPLTVERGAALWTSFLAVFHAKSTAEHLEGAAWRKTSGRSSCGSWQMSLQGLSLPRTSPGKPLTRQPMTLRRWVTPPTALPFPRRTWVATTFGSDIGLLHTPTHTANYACASMQKWPNCREFVRVFGKPTPTNHEWLMAWPIGWTDLRPLAMDKFHAWRSLHSAPCTHRSDSQATAGQRAHLSGGERSDESLRASQMNERAIP
jgi:hypothetical protein